MALMTSAGTSSTRPLAAHRDQAAAGRQAHGRRRARGDGRGADPRHAWPRDGPGARGGVRARDGGRHVPL